MRFLFSGGGTGGGVYPALAVTSALKALHPDAEILWMGSTTGPERDLVSRAGLDYQGVPGGPIVGVGLRAIPSAVKIMLGTLKAVGIIRRYKPAALLLTGGWATIPPALACWALRIPVLIYMPDVEPGSTIQVLSKISAKVAVTASRSVDLFPAGKAVETGYPLRERLLELAGFDAVGAALPAPAASRKDAVGHFVLDADLPTLFVFGGSKGARSINSALLENLPAIIGSEEAPVCQILHISGRQDWDAVSARVETLRNSLPPGAAARYHLFEYLHTDEMALAFTAADLVVSRAGASTLGEFPLFALPAILVPYPHAWRYQKTNADYLVSRGTALRLDDEHLQEQLAPAVIDLMQDTDRRKAMSDAAARLSRPDAAARIAALMVNTAGYSGFNDQLTQATGGQSPES